MKSFLQYISEAGIQHPEDKAYAPKYGEASMTTPPRHKPFWTDEQGLEYSPVYWDNPENPAVPAPGSPIVAAEDRPQLDSGHWTDAAQPSQYPHETGQQYRERMTGRIDKPTLANPNPPQPKPHPGGMQVKLGAKQPGWYESHSWTERKAIQQGTAPAESESEGERIARENREKAKQKVNPKMLPDSGMPPI
jgi:hypothetical protein